MSKLVADTNVILSSFISTGPPRLIVNRIRDRLDLLCVSPPILDEYLVVLQRAGLSADLLASLFSLFQDPDRILLAFPFRHLNVIPDDPSDNMFIECAVEAGADYLISGDQHLKRLKSFQDIQIVSPREYLSRLREE